MKKLCTLLLLSVILISGYSQNYSFEVKMENLKQINETEMQWDVFLRKGTGSDDFALYTMQLRWQFNPALVNGGSFQTSYLTILDDESELYQPPGWFTDAHFTSISATELQWATIVAPSGGQAVTIVDDTWRKVARFKAELRNADGTLFNNFNDVDAELAFESSGLFVLLRRCDGYSGSNPDAVMVGEGNSSVARAPGCPIPPLGVPVEAKQMCGYWFTGKGVWDEQTTKGVYPRWNNKTDINRNVLPGETNNAVVNGRANVIHSHAVKSVRVYKGGFMEIDETGQFTTDYLENENQEEEAKQGKDTKLETVTLAEWDFEDLTKNNPDDGGYTADNGTTANTDVAVFTIAGDANARFDDWYTVGGGSRAPFGDRFYRAGDYDSWRIQLSTNGFDNLKLSFQQYVYDNNGPLTWKVQWSLDGLSWSDVSGSNNTLAGSEWNSLNNIELPSDVNDQSTVYIQWLYHTGVSEDETGMDNITITGEPLPVGVLVRVGPNGTGSLIHYNTGVQGLVERYIKEASYNMVSIPFTQGSNPVSGWFIWSYLFQFDVAAQDWDPLGTPTNTPLFVDQGYMVYKYPGSKDWSADTNYIMEGTLNSGDFTCNVTGSVDDFHLVPNPYPSIVDWDADPGWEKQNLNDAYWLWKPAEANYASYIKGAGTNGATQFIPVGYSFFVQAEQANPILTMDNDVRKHPTSKDLKEAKEEQDILRIKALANDCSDEIVVRFLDESTNNFDSQYDASKMYGLEEAPQLYSVSEDLKQLSINSLPVTPAEKTIPLGFKLGVSGLCTLEASSIDSFDPDVEIHLFDLLTGQQIDLRQQQVYTFAHEPTNEPMRFELLFNGATTIIESNINDQDFFFIDGYLYLNFTEDIPGPFEVLVFNVNGQLEFSGTAPDSKSVVNLSSLAKGFHIIRLVNANYSNEKKVIYQ